MVTNRDSKGKQVGKDNLKFKCTEKCVHGWEETKVSKKTGNITIKKNNC